ncbi:TspO/MBR family protein [Horticoccus sp. 23ND18S-11]|uniref:TspO/MBR family protein n=1 Tax=Horticoccus sp. 23ND18S-11 TaxID=3391832 RepID=UPI0039C98C9F
MTSRRYPALVVFLLVTFAAAAIGSTATFPNVSTWYPTLNKPSWTPPGWLFGPVWSCLYLAMAVAAWRVWRKSMIGNAAVTAWLYGLQLVLNALWSVLFFGLKQPGFALVDIVALWLLLLGLLVRFWRADRIAGALWTPYFLWVTFASGLNTAIWWLNR